MAQQMNIKQKPIGINQFQQPTKPILKQTSQSIQNSAVSSKPISELDGVSSNDSSNNEAMFTDASNANPKWKRPKVPGSKVTRKLKRLRLNRRLKRTVMPKNAIMVLNEMKTGVKLNLLENQSMPNSLFIVQAELDGKVFVGQGLSKPLARQNAAENALKSLLLEKMTAAAMKVKDDETEELNCPSINNDDNVDENDEVPWSLLASFALYKLFLDWQNQGTVVPYPKLGATQTPVKQKPEPRLPVEKKLPPNCLSIHPVMLLNQMKPGSTYVEVSRVGNPPHTVFTLSVEIDGKVYTGEAKNKKDAKKNAAKAALLDIYQLKYPDDDGNNDMEMKIV